MKNIFLSLLALAVTLPGQAAETRSLPAPVITGGMPLMEAINARSSARDFSARPVDDQTLGEILWVAWGQNSHGKRTIPTARNLQNMQLYLATPQGAWKYHGNTHSLEKVTDENLIPYCNRQDYVPQAPVHLIYAIQDNSRGHNHVGSAYQNVYLYATWKGLSCVIRGMIDIPALNKALNLPEGETVALHQCLGWPEESAAK